MNLFTKQKSTGRLREWTYGYWGGVWVKDRELGNNMYTAIFEIDNQQGPTIAQETAQYYVTT